MKKHELQTPAILLDLDKLEHNIQSWQALCNENGKQLWPMIKTHKSTALAKMQLDAGATGFLCGTLDECETVKRKKQVSSFPIPSLWIWISTASGCQQMQLWIS